MTLSSKNIYLRRESLCINGYITDKRDSTEFKATLLVVFTKGELTCYSHPLP